MSRMGRSLGALGHGVESSKHAMYGLCTALNPIAVYSADKIKCPLGLCTEDPIKSARHWDVLEVGVILRYLGM